MNLIEERIHERIIAKKIQVDSHRFLSDAVVKRLHQNAEMEYTYNSNAIEGNTLTLRETQSIIREGITIRERASMSTEAINHPKAIAYIENLAKHDLREEDILRIHEMI